MSRTQIKYLRRASKVTAIRCPRASLSSRIIVAVGSLKKAGWRLGSIKQTAMG
jgi:hypothetical protein